MTDVYSPLEDLNPVFWSLASTSAVKNACTNDHTPQQMPTPKRMSIKGASPAKGAVTIISNKPISKSFTSGWFISSFSSRSMMFCTISAGLDESHLAGEVKEDLLLINADVGKPSHQDHECPDWYLTRLQVVRMPSRFLSKHWKSSQITP